MSPFIPGIELSSLFYNEVVQPILNAEFPGLAYSAALIGDGSEVLGFDTEMSSDHDWGPRLLLFLTEEDYADLKQKIEETLRQRLPHTFRGYSTNFSPPNPNDNSTQTLESIESGPVNHRVAIHTLRGFVQAHLGFDLQNTITPADWLTFPEQKLRTLVAGAVYRDGIGLQTMRDRFAYYPRDVWLYLMAAEWNRISQEDHLMGRAGYVGDEIGSAIIGARLVRDLMRLCFLMERQYAPYPKWFGTAFSLLECAGALSPALQSALRSETWQEREANLCAAYEKVAAMHNALQLTEPQPEKVSNFFGRPFKVIGGSFVESLRLQITDPQMMRIAQNRLIGSIDQFSDSTDLLSDPLWRPLLRGLYPKEP
jgi:hypothetical protein